jgi:UDPglucose 6-dehydrogenase
MVVVYDPAAMNKFKRLFNNKIFYAKSALECIKNTDCAMVVTEWEEFKNLQPETFLSHMKHPVIVDGRRIYDVATFSPKLKFAAIGLHTGASS